MATNNRLIMIQLEKGVQTSIDLIEQTGIKKHKLECTLSRMFKCGEIHRDFYHGVYKGESVIKLPLYSLTPIRCMNVFVSKLYTFLNSPTSINQIEFLTGSNRPKIMYNLKNHPDLFVQTGIKCQWVRLPTEIKKHNDIYYYNVRKNDE